MSHETSPRVARKRELKTEAVLDAATALLEAEGLDGVTLGRVAAAMDLVPAALYRYYDSKDALLAGLQRRAVAQISDVVQAALAELPATRSEAQACLSQLLAMAEAYATLPQRAPGAWHLVSLMLAEPKPLLSPEEAGRTAPMLGVLVLSLRDALERAGELGVLGRGDVDARVLSFWAAVHGAAALVKIRLWVPELPDSRTTGLEAVTSLLTAWGAKPRELEAAKRLIAKRKEAGRGAPAGWTSAREGARS